ncbi:MAG TPA: HAMP domain-containing sensor histidine kinase [Acidimicrobiia bacterium]|nr:HAMP domain-containing sensor histidine kinase [Acidimicrobiia bacterium]
MRLSLRARLLLAVASVALVGLVAADIATYTALRSFLLDRVDESLTAAQGRLVRSIYGPPERGRGGDAGGLAAAAPGAYVELRGPDGLPVVSGPTSGEFDTSRPRLPERVSGLSSSDEVAATFFTVEAARGASNFRVRAQRLPDDSVLMVALPLTDVSSTLHRLLLTEIIVTAGVLLVAVGLGLWLVRVGLRPLRNIEETAAEIAGGELSSRVPDTDERTEVGRLGVALNTMLERIEDAFAKQQEAERQLRRFVADASHELRTPVSAVGAYAELFERGAQQRPDDLARVLRGVRVETSRMQALIEDLLLLTRLDEGRPLERQPVELVGLAGEAVEAAQAISAEWPLSIEAAQPVEVTGDRMRLREVLDNLLANVRTHTPPGTPTTVQVRASGAEAVIEVADEGPGLEAEDAARVFERFYRADPSRARDRGGSGLGLAVVAALVGAHGGRVEVDTSRGDGATFRVRLPLTAPVMPEEPVPR